ncbi:MAG: hypothetical protein N2036_05620 [Bryobacteraceae bacterium]|nr:hypothetical protein [Bryobacteraceae bacterium]
MALTRRFLLAAALGGGLRAAQPVLVPCIASAREGAVLRLVFREPGEAGRRAARTVLLVRLRGRAPERVRLNGRETALRSRAGGWAALELPRGARRERIELEPGEPFEGCNDAATAPYLVLEPPPPKQ